MARYYAITVADIVGSMDPLPAPSSFFVNSTTSIAVTYPNEYSIINTTSLANDAEVTSVTYFTSPVSPTPGIGVGAGDVAAFWKPDSGDGYLANDLLAILGIPVPPTGTEQALNQFLFQFDDKIRGSEFDDMLCGWAGNDTMWGGEGDDRFYYGKGMDKDKIRDFDRKDDKIILDNSIANKFKQIKNDVKFKKNDKVVIDAGGGDKLIVWGIANKKQLKQALSFEDFTDFA